jgi:1-aminocyclopropane-1-carboxylate deaminase/D-cysteine desulfhydrase-like pyridoxal-dependent ACC family enzyme
MILSNTPIEKYIIDNREIYVKREDKCCPLPSFSKLRGVKAHLNGKVQQTIGVLDTFHSKAGWGTSLICKSLNKKCVVFYPVYKHNPGMRSYQRYAQELGADLIGLDAGRSFILYQYAKKILANKYINSYMMPNALKLKETIQETSREVYNIPGFLFKDTTWVISVSSGTVAAGVIKGVNNAQVNIILHEGYSRSITSLLSYVLSFSDFNRDFITVVDEHYEYKDNVNFPCPFPCNPYYDLKAWKWLVSNLKNIKTKNILFWNIGV